MRCGDGTARRTIILKAVDVDTELRLIVAVKLNSAF
jgi:hypothetical protein